MKVSDTAAPFVDLARNLHVKMIDFAPGRGERRGLGPRTDVFTTCKAVTQLGDQRIITVFFPQEIFLDFLEARRKPAEEIRNA